MKINEEKMEVMVIDRITIELNIQIDGIQLKRINTVITQEAG